MLSIALFTECFHPMRNGVVVSVASFARMLTLLGHRVTIFTARHPEQEADVENVYRLPSIMFPTRARYPIAIPIATGAVRQALCNESFDIIHSNATMTMGHLALAWARRRRIPLVFTYHTLIEEYAHYIPLPGPVVRYSAVRISRDYSNAADHIITPSAHVAQRLRHYQVVKPITVIPTGIDIATIDSLPACDVRTQFDIPPGVPLLVYVGRLAREKNIPRLLHAFREVLRHEPDAHLLLIGGGPFDLGVRGLLHDYGIAHRTRMTGFLSREQVMQGLLAANIFIFASLTETQGLVLGEAMACGKPVVSVDSAAARELVTHGVNGLLTPDENTPFAEAILTLIRDHTLCERMGEFARKRAELLSEHSCTEQLLTVYAQVISERG